MSEIPSTKSDYVRLAGSLVMVGSIALSAWHGTKRNCGSLGWGLLWGLGGAALGPIMPLIGWAQGFSEPGPSCNRR